MFARCCCAKDDSGEADFNNHGAPGSAGYRQDYNGHKEGAYDEYYDENGYYEGDEGWYNELEGEWEEAYEGYEEGEYGEEYAEADGPAEGAGGDGEATEAAAAAGAAGAGAGGEESPPSPGAEGGAEGSGERQEAGVADAPENSTAGAIVDPLESGWPRTFVVQLVKHSSEGLCGWQLDSLDGKSLFVSDLGSDANLPVQEYNRNAAPEVKVRPFDYVVKVNGDASVEGMSDNLRSKVQLSVMLRRPAFVEFRIPKGPKGLGLDLKYSPNGASLLIEHLRDGAVSQGGYEIRPNDRIVKVEGNSGKRAQLLASLKAADPVLLTLCRCTED